MISELIYTSPYPNTNIIKTLAVVRGVYLVGFELADVAATFLVVTATMQVMIIVIILPGAVLMEMDTVLFRSAAVLKDVALLP